MAQSHNQREIERLEGALLRVREALGAGDVAKADAIARQALRVDDVPQTKEDALRLLDHIMFGTPMFGERK